MESIAMATNTSVQALKTTNANGVSNLNTTNLALTNTILIAKFDYESKEAHELSLKKNERLILIDNTKNWWLVKKHDSDQTGYVPSNYVKKEKKSILDKIIPRKLHSVTNFKLTHNSDENNNSNNNNNNNNNKTNQINPTNMNYISKAIVKHKYTANKSDELTMSAGTIVKVLEKFGDGWWKVAAHLDDKDFVGLYPSNYLQEETNSYGSISKSKSQSNSFKTLHEQLSLSNTMDTELHLNPTKCESITSIDRDIEYVRVRHSYKAKSNNELSVTLNEILKLIEEDNELDFNKSWLKVFSSQGITGIIPSSCVEPIIELKSFIFVRRPTTVGLFASKIWYFGNVSRFDTILLLNKYATNGDYLVRDSDNGNYSISLKSENLNNKHFKVILKENRFIIGKKMFNSMVELLDHYHKNPIYDQGGEKLYLIKPFSPPSIAELNQMLFG